eukprot:10948917-Heterocapsa_arctica.AAC.1
MKALKHLLLYVQHTRDYAMHFSRTRDMADEILEVVTDAGWRGDEHGRSTSGAVLSLSGWTLQTLSRTQSVVALSSCEAELLAMSVGVGEANMIQSLLSEFGVKVIIHLKSDSSSARAVTQRRGLCKLRHIDLRELWLQQEVRDGTLLVEAVSTDEH